MKINRKQIRYSLQLLLHLQKNKVVDNQDGYAMLITSILAILMFSMLSVYLFSANMYKSVANAVVDSGSTFYAAESGMNQRASDVIGRFQGYAQPTGTEPAGGDIATQMQSCINNPNAAAGATVGTGDLGCRFTDYEYKESMWKARALNRSTEEFRVDPDVRYRVHSFVKRITTDLNPAITRVPPGENFAGLNMQEYRYRLYATAFKNTSSQQSSAQTLLQMDFNSRLIPLFQFAAFYQGNMEVSSSSNMSLNGPVHSNQSIYYGPGGVLTVGQTTAVGAIYKSLIGAGCPSGAGRAIQFAIGAAISTSCTASTPMTATDISDRNGLMINGAPLLGVPAAGFLDTTGDYFGKADLQVTFDPNNVNAHPYGFGLTAVRRVAETATTAATATLDVFSNEALRSLRQPVMVVTQAHTSPTLAENKTVSLNTMEWRNLCTAAPSGINGLPAGTIPGKGANFTSVASPNSLTGLPASLTGWNLGDAQLASNALRQAIAKSGTMLSFTQVNGSNINSFTTSSIPTLPALNTAFSTELAAVTFSSGDVAKKAALVGAVTPRQIANMAGNCFLPPPMQVLNTPAGTLPVGTAAANNLSQPDRQETDVLNGRLMRILQSNIHSLTVWNRDGVYSNPTGTGVLPADGKVFARTAAVTDGSMPDGSYDWMGMAATDRTEGGLVWHSAVDAAVPEADRGVIPPPAITIPPTRPTYNGISQYGFGFSGGRWLPGPLTIASDQIVYLQGDLNNPGGVQPTANGDDVFAGAVGSAGANNFFQKKPAAVLGDAIAVLSNNCVNSNGQMDCFNVPAGAAVRDATRTTVNSAFLSGTSTGGGLNNYMRMMENWHFGRAGVQTATSENLGPTIFRYRGSFISTGPRQMVSGIYRSGCSDGTGASIASATCFYNVPERDFGFELAFNAAAGLPPLTPSSVTLKQKVFRRDYNSDRTQF
jgi:hypothetical protein